MPKATKKILCYAAITSILNLSFQPAYAGKSDLSLMSEEMAYTQKVSHHLTQKGLRKERLNDPGLEDPQAHVTNAPQAGEPDVVSWLFLAPLKTMIGAVSLVRQGVRFALENPGKAIGMGLLLQARTATSTLSLSGLTPNQGFNISGASASDQSGYSVSSAGDFNGDGLNDVIIGAPAANYDAGNSYLIYGTNNTPGSIILSSLTPLQGFNISGAAGDDSGISVSSAGDFNGDGLNDVIIGAPGLGKSYLIYGTNSTPGSIILSSLMPLQGFIISGAANDQSGRSVSSAGDFNGDGLNDVIIGAPAANTGAGKSYLILGTNSTPSLISLSSLTPLQGFAISGAANDNSGASVSSAGDFNGDGLNDVIIGAPGVSFAYPGKSYIIYGTISTPSSISLNSLTPLQGFTINGAKASDQCGTSVSSAGDFNGDALNDVIIGAPYANTGAGKSYLIYGTKTLLSLISLSSLTPLQGFAINGAKASDYSGISVSSAGDFNGDGLNDVIIGAYNANNGAGDSYVIYGVPAPSPASTSMMTSAGTGSSATIPTNQVTSANPTTSSSLSMTTNPTSEGTGASETGSSVTSASSTRGSNPTNNPPHPSPPEQSTSETVGTSWQTAAAIGGGIGAVVLVGAVGGIIAKICYFSKKDKADDTDVELVVGNPETSTSKNIGASASSSRSVSPFAPTSTGFTEHPTFVGKLHDDTYEIWKTLSKREAGLLRPLTYMQVPVVPESQNVSFNLGTGNFGATYAGNNHQTHEIYAIKEVYGREAVEESLREGKIVHSLGDHPNIMSLIDYMHFKPSERTEEPRLLQVMPLAYINGIGFRGMLSFSRDDLRERVVSDSFRQMMMGLNYIHSQGVVHLDIKADNTLYMKGGTLRIADYGRAKDLGDNDQIADPYSGLGDMRKFSPEIIALFRHFMGGNGEKVQSISGKAADAWAAGLYIWELLEDNTSNLFSCKSAPIRARVAKYTYARFKELVEKVKLLEEKYSQPLLNILRHVLKVDSNRRIQPSQVINHLSSSTMTRAERRTAFEGVIRLGTEPAAAAQASASVYPTADRTQYLPRASDQSPASVYVPGSLYPGGPGQANDNAGQMNPVFAVNQGE